MTDFCTVSFKFSNQKEKEKEKQVNLRCSWECSLENQYLIQINWTIRLC